MELSYAGKKRGLEIKPIHIQMRNKHTIREEEQIECLKEDLNYLEKKWIKTPQQKREIDFLKKYIELKQKMVKELKNG